LLISGAAERIVRAALRRVGPQGAPLAFSASGFVLGIPVFFDSVFLLTIPLAKATWLKLRKNYLLFTMALITGGTITHSLVPPTPGPLFAAKELGVSIGLMILVGTGVGLCCTASGLAFAYWINTRMELPVREPPESLEQLQLSSDREQSGLPSIWLALTPVVLPVLLISGVTIYESALDPGQTLPPMVKFLGDTNMALILAAAISLAMAAAYLPDRQVLADQMQQAMQEAGLIILVCCGGGAFGAALQQSGIGPYISGLTGKQPLDFSLLPLSFLVAAAVRTAQGSSTVAMLTAVEIVRSLAPDLTSLSYHPVYLAVGIGCGSKPIPWMNDSGFWVISKTSGLTEREMLRTHTPMVSLMGVVGIGVTMLFAKLLPLQ
jgi:GntP family gluconate:H+ symporter